MPRTRVYLASLALLLCLGLSGCSVASHQSFGTSVQCSDNTHCRLTLTSGADNPDALDWTMAADNKQVVISPDHGTIRPGTSVAISLTLPENVCPISITGTLQSNSPTILPFQAAGSGFGMSITSEATVDGKHVCIAAGAPIQ